MANREKANRKLNRNGGLNMNYLTKMGIRNVFANSTMSLSSIGVLTACLLLIGVSCILVLNICNLVHDVQKQNVVVAFVNDDVDESGVKEIGDKLRALMDEFGFVEEDDKEKKLVDYKSKDEAFREQLDDFGVNRDEMKDLIENPLPDSFRITVPDINKVDEVITQVKKIDGIGVIRESQEIVKQITILQRSVTIICLILVVALVIVSLFIVANTVRITMASRKVDIQVMKSVGATNAFIRWPFMIEGIFIGLVSGLLAMGLTYLLQITEGDALYELFRLFGAEVFTFDKYILLFLGGYILAGVLLGSFGSVMSLLRYLKKEGSESALNL